MLLNIVASSRIALLLGQIRLIHTSLARVTGLRQEHTENGEHDERNGSDSSLEDTPGGVVSCKAADEGSDGGTEEDGLFKRSISKWNSGRNWMGRTE